MHHRDTPECTKTIQRHHSSPRSCFNNCRDICAETPGNRKGNRIVPSRASISFLKLQAAVDHRSFSRSARHTKRCLQCPLLDSEQRWDTTPADLPASSKSVCRVPGCSPWGHARSSALSVCWAASPLSWPGEGIR